MAEKTVRGHGLAEVIIKKSQFLANVAPVRSEEEALAFLQQIRAQHSEATHNCWAYKVGKTQRLSDDGEPSGTAGRPIFDVIEKQGLTDVIIVVTRYFGGILLGSGGLVRAYSQAAVAGVEAAGILETVPAVDLEIKLDYGLVGKVQYILQQVGAMTLGSDFAHEVTILCRVLAGGEEELEAKLAEASAGRILVRTVQKVMVGPDMQPR